MYLWWLIAALVLLAIEVLTTTIWSSCVAAGCVGALLADLCGVPVLWQVVTFAVVTVLACSLLLPRLKKAMHRRDGSNDAVTNADAMIGRTATVIQRIRPGETGRVKLDGDSWQAMAVSPAASYDIGDKVTVRAIDSIVLIIE